MRITLTAATLLATCTTSVLGHAYLKTIVIGGESYLGYDPFAGPQGGSIVQNWNIGQVNTDYPIMPGDGDAVVCKQSPRPAGGTATAQAGSKITFRWSRWQGNHKGPIITYLADCGGDCKRANGARLSWFKIDEAGLLGRRWATDILMQQGYQWTIQLPQNIQAGEYLMRHEMIALMNAASPSGAQIYPQCMNLKITGGGNVKPKGVRLQPFYAPGQRGIQINIRGINRYPIPGPPISPQLKILSSAQLNNGNSRNPTAPRFFPNEPTDFNGSIPNVHLRFANGRYNRGRRQRRDSNSTAIASDDFEGALERKNIANSTLKGLKGEGAHHDLNGKSSPNS
ncbi:Endoglucanase-4 [Arthrobotrys entomopaga]|nr:Endoglucanase-4 [Arthrobotrys entomopaga]